MLTHITLNFEDEKKSSSADVPISQPSSINESATGTLSILGHCTIPGVVEAVDADGRPITHCRWYLDDVLSGEGSSFALTDDANGKTLQAKASADAAPLQEQRSEPQLIIDSFQSISREESENSFVKQFGAFSVHSPANADRLLSTTAGAYALLTSQRQLLVGGKTTHGATLPAHFANYLKSNGSERVFTTEKDFAALVTVESSNRLILWGPNIPDSIPYPLGGIQAVYANQFAFAFIYRDLLASGNRIGAAGNISYGATIPDAVQLSLANDPPKAIYATLGAFAVLTQQGCVYAWGNPAYGGAIDAAVRAKLDTIRVKKIFSTIMAFCVVGENDEIVTWGDANYGGAIPAAALEKIMDDGGAFTVVAAQMAFCAITRGRRKAVSWGLAANGGTLSTAAGELAARGNIVLCKAAPWAFCIIDQSGQAEAWGNATYGGTLTATAGSGINSMTDSTETEGTEAIEPGIGDVQNEIKALFNTSASFGTASSSVDPILSRYVSTEGVTQLLANDGGFCILSQYPDGRTRNMICWGHPTYSTLPNSTKQILMASIIQHMACSNGAYAAVTRQGTTRGCVVTWGSPSNDGGTIPPDVLGLLESGVVELYPTPTVPGGSPATVSGFAARREDGKIVFWGGAIMVGTVPA